LIYNFLDTDLIYNCVGMLSGVAFNKINNIEFDQMIEAAGRFGPGGKKPNQHQLREALLFEEV
jgi:hypothetical protein